MSVCLTVKTEEDTSAVQLEMNQCNVVTQIFKMQTTLF